MTSKQISTLLIALIGLNAIFNAILLSGLQFSVVVLSLFQDGGESVAFSSLVLIPQFLVPLLFGIILLRTSPRLADWLLAKTGVDTGKPASWPTLEDASFLIFSALGLYMLSVTAPDALKLLAAWFHFLASEPGYLGAGGEDGFWSGRFPEAVYHAAAVGFSAFVFFRGASLSRFLLSLRKTHPASARAAR